MSEPLNLPGPIASATVRRWYVQPGQAVQSGDLICLAEGEDALVEVRASRALTVARILCQAGQTVSAGQPLCELGDGMSATGPTSATSASSPPTGAATAAPPPDASIVIMPKAGQTMEEGTIVKWRVAEGQAVQKGEIIFEVETDKAVIEVEAMAAGVLRKILVTEGQTVPVKAPVAVIAPADANIDALVARLAQEGAGAGSAEGTATATAPPAAPSAAAPSATPGRLLASPAARRLARENRIDLASVRGSGPGGRIKAADVLAAASAGPPAPRPAAPPPAAPAPAPAAPTPGVPVLSLAEPRKVQLTRMRKAIAQNLSWSKQHIPHFYATVTVDATGLKQAHRFLKKALGSTMNDVVIAAVARSLVEFPALRCRWEEEGVIELQTVSIGIAVGTDDGLRVPVLEHAHTLSLAEIARRARALVEAARQNRLTQSGPASLTITNMGMFGVEQFSPIINPPESAILAVGAVRSEPVVRGGQIVAADVMSLTLACDHRIVDGLVAARFLARVKERLENIEALLEETR